MKIKMEKKDYLAAMDRLATKGLAKQMFDLPDGRSCMIGHIKHVKNLDIDQGADAANAMGFRFSDLTMFNDASDTTADDVQTFLAFGAAGAFKDLHSPAL